MSRFPDGDPVEMGSELEASDHTGGPAIDSNPVRKRWAEHARKDGGTGRQRVWEPEVFGHGAPGSGGSRQDGLSGPEIRLESTRGGNAAENGSGAGKRAGNDWPRLEDISPESREAKVLWRQWERLYLVGGVLHRRFHELEGQGWRPQLVVQAACP